MLLVSPHDLMVCFIIILSLIITAFKWYKSLLVIVILEFSSIIILAEIFCLHNGSSIFLLLLLVFMVGEALILLSAFFSIIQVVGMNYSPLIIF